MGPLMTIVITKSPSRSASNGVFDDGSAQVRAHSRHLATVLTIRGEVDAVNVDRVSEYVRRFILQNAHVVVDMSAVSHFAPAGISLLHMLDEDCRADGVECSTARFRVLFIAVSPC